MTDDFRLECFQSETGLKFYVTADRNQSGLSNTLRGIYTIYSDYVLKNPFYELDQPIKCELFEHTLKSYLSSSKKE